MRILFVCLGNICRSVAAQHVFERLAAEAGVAVEADSAGLIGYHAGELADERMRHAASRRGYRLTHRSRPVEAADFERFDLIFGMDERNVEKLCRMAPTPEAATKVKRMADCLTRHTADHIPDPYYDGSEAFDHVLDLLEDACAELIRRLQKDS